MVRLPAPPVSAAARGSAHALAARRRAAHSTLFDHVQLEWLSCPVGKLKEHREHLELQRRGATRSTSARSSLRALSTSRSRRR
mmetsp:Transcript_3584/g.11521  ORF Transcript_3584/g.11521 Transcript_3584/m.11521 type:complete len:83 (-) Transcript_3584:559-807(-)